MSAAGIARGGAGSHGGSMAPASSSAVGRRSPATPRWLDGMSWERVAWLFAIALGLALFSGPADFVYRGVLLTANRLDIAASFVLWFVRYLVSLTPILIAMTIADNLRLRGAKRVLALTVALVLGAQVLWPIQCTFAPVAESACDDFTSHLLRSWLEMWGGGTLWAIMLAAPMALVYFSRRRDLRLAAALHDAELARADLQRRTLESDLQAMQARVEPTFLFDTLGDIGDLFDSDPVQGARMLDELIVYLRAALPDMRAAHSTLGKEAALARAYIAILDIRAPGRMTHEIDVPAALADAPMPPMMLLPLLAAVLGPSLGTVTAASKMRIDARADGQRLRVILNARGPALPALGDKAVARQVRERLQSLYGTRGALSIDDERGRRLTVVMEVPHDAS